MQEPIETYEHNEYTISIHHDVASQDPREYDQLGIMVCDHGRYDLGDVQAMSIEDAGIDPSDVRVMLPLFLFDHSGLTISTSESKFRAWDARGWDWGQLGVIVATQERIDLLGVPDNPREIHAQLVAEVEEYNDFIQGNVVGYVVEYLGDHVDSCWGFIGDEGYAYAKRMAASVASNDDYKRDVEANQKQTRKEQYLTLKREFDKEDSNA